jgi:hypothetical protein
LQAVIPREKIAVFVAVYGLMAVGFHAAAGTRHPHFEWPIANRHRVSA